MKINQDINTHLEYLGYAMVPDSDAFVFMKPGLPTIFIEQLSNNRVTLNARYPYNNNATNNELGFLNYLNTLNQKSYIATFITVSDSLAFCAMYTGLYDRIEFGQFIQAWEHDSTTLLNNTPETHFFLMEDSPSIDSDLMNLAIDKQYAA